MPLSEFIGDKAKNPIYWIYYLEEIAKFKKLLPQKDIPILFGAIVSKAQVLITLDKKHFLGNEKLRKMKFPCEIMNPGDFLGKYFRLGKK